MNSQTPMWVYLIPLAMVAVGFLIASQRTGSVASAAVGHRRLELTTTASPAEAFARIALIAGKYKIDDRDASRGILVLSSGISFGSWGFLYPVFITANGTGSQIDIGIHSKLIQFGPIVGLAHRKLRDAIEAAVSAPAARVA